MKKVILPFLLFGMFIALFGCTSESSPGTLDSSEPESSITGVILSFEGDLISLKSGNGGLVFQVSPTVPGSNEVATGDEIEIFYRGVIAGSDTSNATITQIKLIQEGAGINEGEKVISGPVITSTNSAVVILVDGTNLTFWLEGADLSEIQNGINEGDTLQIIYTGEIKEGDASNTKVKSIKTLAKADGTPVTGSGNSNTTGQPTESENKIPNSGFQNGANSGTETTPPITTKQIEGTALDISLNNLVMMTAENKMLAFSITGLDLPQADYESGKIQVIVSYTGEIKGTDTTGATVTKVEIK